MDIHNQCSPVSMTIYNPVRVWKSIYNSNPLKFCKNRKNTDVYFWRVLRYMDSMDILYICVLSSSQIGSDKNHIPSTTKMLQRCPDFPKFRPVPRKIRPGGLIPGWLRATDSGPEVGGQGARAQLLR